MTPEAVRYLLFLVVVIESYYWFWWLPRHWKEVKECRDIAYFLSAIKENK